MTHLPGTKAVGLIALLAMACAGCSSTSVQCDCVDPAIRVHVPADREALVTTVALSGPACAGVKATCETQGAHGCGVYAWRAIAAGKCEVDVYFGSGPATFHAEIEAVSGGCCGGFYAQPPSAADLDVPGASDAGGSG